MTVKEVEERTGLPRANIRYYESEGLIHPARGENGYRDYRQEDVDTLLKVKLLRQVGFSLEEILSLQKGALALEPALDRRIAALTAEQTELGQAAGVCRAMREDHVRYDTLDAPAYLERMEVPERPSLTWKEDSPAKPASPWRRFLARALDLGWCNLLWGLYLTVGQRELVTDRTGAWAVLDTIAVMALLLVLEPLFLHFFGATPGKFLLGLRLTRSDGSYLSYWEGGKRTFLVLAVGMGFQIPVLGLVLMGVSLWRVYRDRPLFWEAGDQAYSDGSRPGLSYWQRKSSYGKMAGAALLFVVCVEGVALGTQFALSPVHQNQDLTVAQFVENYNQFGDTLAGPEGIVERLTEEGTFLEPELPPNTFLLDMAERAPFQLDFHEEDGVLTEISYTYRWEPGETDDSVFLPVEETAKIIWNFLYGRSEFSREELLEMMEQIEEMPNERVIQSRGGASLSYQPEIQGYAVTPFSASFGLYPQAEAEKYRVYVEFSVSLA